MRIIGSLTTIPSRIGNIEETLISIFNQHHKLDAVYLNVPYTSNREDDDYQIPTSLNNYCHIIRGEDYGPITKLIGALMTETDPQTIIITFDDDKIYPAELVEKLVSKHRSHPNCAIGSSGLKIGRFPFYASMTSNDHSSNNRWYSFDVSTDGEPVDVLFGESAVLYKRNFFPRPDDIAKLLQYTTSDDVLYNNDDVVISGFLSMQEIDRYVFRMPRVRDSGNNSNNLSSNKNMYFFSLIKAIYKTLDKEMFPKHVKYSRTKTITYPLILILAAIILFSILFSTRKPKS